MTDNEQAMQDAPQDGDTVITDPETDAAPEEETLLEEEGFEWKTPPVFEIEHKEDCVCQVKVTIPADNVKHSLNEVYDEVNDGMQVPGFRKGKAPRKLLEKRMGKMARRTVAERLAELAAKRLVRQHHLMPVSEVTTEGLEDVDNLSDEADMVYTLTFEVPGECTLGDYKGLELEQAEYEIPEERVDESIEEMQMRFGRFEPLTEGVAEDGDQVIIDFEGMVDGEAFSGNSVEAYPYILGSKRFGEEIEGAIRGAKAGDAVSTELVFPEDHRDPAVAGKTAKYAITIHEIKRRVLPELNEEFAKKLGHDSVEALRESLRKRMAENVDDQIAQYLRQQALAKLIEGATFTLPKSQIEDFVQSEEKSMEDEMLRQHVPAEDIETQREQMRAFGEARGLFAIKSMYALQTLAKAESITVDEEDFDKHAQDLSGNDQSHYEEIKKYLQSDEMRNMTEYRILERKTLDKLVSLASIKIISAEEAAAAEAAMEADASAGADNKDTADE